MHTAALARIYVCLLASSLVLCGQAAPEPIKLGSVVLSGSIRSRVESWEWFTPNTGDPSYTFLGNHMRLNFTRPGKRFDWTIELESPVLLGLPDNAVAAGAQGQLGLGASYFVANDRKSNVGMVFPKQVSIRLKSLFGGEASSLKIGRFEFQDGATVAAHVQHLSYGLSLLNRWAVEGADAYANPLWDVAWQTSKVSASQWKESCLGLREEIQNWRATLGSPRELDEVELKGLIASVAHLAYHLGAIRQIAPASRGPKDGTFTSA